MLMPEKVRSHRIVTERCQSREELPIALHVVVRCHSVASANHMLLLHILSTALSSSGSSLEHLLFDTDFASFFVSLHPRCYQTASSTTQAFVNTSKATVKILRGPLRFSVGGRREVQSGGQSFKITSCAGARTDSGRRKIDIGTPEHGTYTAKDDSSLSTS